jgi:hypothetical protein
VAACSDCMNSALARFPSVLRAPLLTIMKLEPMMDRCTRGTLHPILVAPTSVAPSRTVPLAPPFPYLTRYGRTYLLGPISISTSTEAFGPTGQLLSPSPFPQR